MHSWPTFSSFCFPDFFFLECIIGLTFPCIKNYQIESNIVRCPNPEYADKMIEAIDAVRVKGNSIGGVVTCIARDCPRVRTPPPKKKKKII